MTPLDLAIWASVVLAAFVCVGGFVWSNRHCLRKSWWQRLSIGILMCASLPMAVNQFARISPDIKALPGNVQVWLLCAILLGIAILVWERALEKRR